MRIAVALAFVLLTLGSAALFIAHPWWFPAGASAQALLVDREFRTAFLVLGTLFVAGHMVLAVVLLKKKKVQGAQPSRGSVALEAAWTLVIAGLFFWFNVSGGRVWSHLQMEQTGSDPIKVEVTGGQFQWYFRYAGPDGKLGRTNVQRFGKPEEGNALGLDPDDPAGKDDLVSTSLVLVAGRDADLTLRSMDVVHSLFVPAMRFKQDTVPGMDIHSHFRPVQPGTYEIACAELCGTGHYRMRSTVRVVSQPEFDAWLNSHTADQTK